MQIPDRNRFALFAKFGREYLPLEGKAETGFGFVGPQIVYQGIWYRFSEPLLETLVKRFKVINGAENITLVSRHQLLEMLDGKPESIICEVGGDGPQCPAFNKYLPELSLIHI